MNIKYVRELCRRHGLDPGISLANDAEWWFRQNNILFRYVDGSYTADMTEEEYIMFKLKFL